MKFPSVEIIARILAEDRHAFIRWHELHKLEQDKLMRRATELKERLEEDHA